MNDATLEALEAVFRQADVGWFVEQDANARLSQAVQEAREVSEYLHAHSDLGEDIDVLAEMIAEPDELTPLVQTFVMPMTTPIRAMVFCILRGARIKSLRYQYEERVRSQLDATLEFGPGRAIEFHSEEHWDAEILHHVGLAKLNGAPFIDGYFAFRKQ